MPAESLNVPHRPHHFVTRNVFAMILIFLLVAGFALGSYFKLERKIHSTSPTKTTKLKPTPTQPVLENPHEYSNGQISFFYPDTLVIHTSSPSAVAWDAKYIGNTYIPNTLVLSKSAFAFTQPQNGDNNQPPSSDFAIDDSRERIINGIDIVEYTVNCGYACYYRVDQFQMGTTFYQLYFDDSKAGYSQQAEMILQTLRKATPTPSPTLAK
ncbi:MAG TPA: hypothetical protein VG935_04275 [Patescibacteria group bacterium]|nr:hypothetical protein [Patescibacteria group bacterium]